MDALKNPFFPGNVIDWNHLDGDIVSTPTVPVAFIQGEASKSSTLTAQSISTHSVSMPE